MRPEKSDLKYAWDMLDAARTVVELTEGRAFAEYEKNKMLRLAIERAIEIIGEAARHVSHEFRGAYPGIPWQAIVATRHVISHEYGDLQHDKVWRIATGHVPALIGLPQPIVDADPPGGSGAGASM